MVPAELHLVHDHFLLRRVAILRASAFVIAALILIPTSSSLAKEGLVLEHRTLKEGVRTATRQFRAAVVNRLGEQLTAWCEEGEQRGTEVCFAQVFNANGDRLGTPVTVLEGWTFCSGLGDLAWIDDSRFAVTTVCESVSGEHVVLQVKDRQQLAANTLVFVTEAAFDYGPPILTIALGTKSFWLIGSRPRTGHQDATLYGLRFEGTGRPLGRPVAIADNTLPTSYDATAMADGDGVLVVWAVQEASRTSKLMSRILDRHGRALASPVRVDQIVGRWVARPAVAVGGTGRLAIVWERRGEKEVDPSDIVIRILERDGFPHGPEQSIIPNASRGSRVRPEINAVEGGFFVAWVESDAGEISVVGVRLGEDAVPRTGPIDLGPLKPGALASRWGIYELNRAPTLTWWVAAGQGTLALEAISLVKNGQ